MKYKVFLGDLGDESLILDKAKREKMDCMTYQTIKKVHQNNDHD